MTKSRFPGVASFEDNELSSLLFFGREEESNQLLHSILAEDITLLYAKSGHGKTSLLQARVFPLLRERYFFPVTFRLNQKGLSPEEAIKEQLVQIRNKYPDDIIGFDAKDKLLDIFNKVEIWSKDNKLCTPVLVFDQFEEIFTLEHNKPFQKAFFDFLKSLLDVINEKGLPLKIIISVREDFLGFLESLSKQIPSIFSNRFRLLGLKKDAAEDAIVKPAQIKIERYDLTEPFTFTAEAKNDLLSFLSLKRVGDEWLPGEDIDPIQLQIICSDLEERIKEDKIPRNKNGKIEITQTILGGFDGMKVILGNFYEHQLQSAKAKFNLNDEQVERLEDVIEKELIVSTRRVPLDYAAILAKGVNKEVLDFILERKLLRKETRGDNELVEISHEALVDPILKTFNRRDEVRKEKERKAELESARLEKLAKDKQKKRKTLLISLIISIIFLSGLIIIYFRFRDQMEIKHLIKGYETEAANLKRSNDSLSKSQKAFIQVFHHDSLERIKTLDSLTAKSKQLDYTVKRDFFISDSLFKRYSALARRAQKLSDSTKNLKKLNLIKDSVIDITNDSIRNINQSKNFAYLSEATNKDDLSAAIFACISLYYLREARNIGLTDNIIYNAAYNVLSRKNSGFNSVNTFQFSQKKSHSIRMSAGHQKTIQFSSMFIELKDGILKINQQGKKDTFIYPKLIAVYESMCTDEKGKTIYVGCRNGTIYQFSDTGNGNYTVKEQISCKDKAGVDFRAGVDFIEVDEHRKILVAATESHIFIYNTASLKDEPMDFETNNTIQDLALSGDTIFVRFINGSQKWYATKPFSYYCSLNNYLKPTLLKTNSSDFANLVKHNISISEASKILNRLNQDENK